MALKQSDNRRTYSEYSKLDYARAAELGNTFQSSASRLAIVSTMIDELLAIIDNNDVADEFVLQLDKYMKEFVEYIKRMIAYNQSDEHAVQIKTQINIEIDKWVKSIFDGKNVDTNYPVNFLTVYNAIKGGLNKNIETMVSEIENMKKEATEVLNELKNKVAEVAVMDYANIFKEQSKKHSNIEIGKWYLRLGPAQLWMGMSVILIGAFIYFICNMKDWFSFSPTDPVSTITIQMLTRLVILSFGIYIISFCFKQYNVQKHLYTMNKHRENTLNSYKLFIASLDSSDPSTRNALMLEVAKAIYESGQTGFISTKDSSDSSPSIIEMTRYLNQK